VGCQVLACELLDDLHHTAKEMTDRCSLGEKIVHLSGNFLSVGPHLHPNVYDSVVSWLTVLHIEERPKLFKTAYTLLRPGGVFFAADFFQLGKLTADEWKVLKDDVSCSGLVGSVSEYKGELEAAGFKVSFLRSNAPPALPWLPLPQPRKYMLGSVVMRGEHNLLISTFANARHASQIREARDVTPAWKGYTAQRVETFTADEENLKAVMGELDTTLHSSVVLSCTRVACFSSTPPAQPQDCFGILWGYIDRIWCCYLQLYLHLKCPLLRTHLSSVVS
jgi:hypothetical protein